MLFRKDWVMSLSRTMCALLWVTISVTAVWGQDQEPQTPEDAQHTPPPAAFGQDTPPVVVNENPPISALDQPSLEPNMVCPAVIRRRSRWRIAWLRSF